MRKAIKVVVVIYVAIIFLSMFSSMGFCAPVFPRLPDSIEAINDHLNCAGPKLLTPHPNHFGPNITSLISYCKVNAAIKYAQSAPTSAPSKENIMKELNKLAKYENNFRNDFAKVLSAYQKKDGVKLKEAMAYMIHKAKERYPLNWDMVADTIYGTQINRALRVYYEMIGSLEKDMLIVNNYLKDCYNDRMSAWEGF